MYSWELNHETNLKIKSWENIKLSVQVLWKTCHHENWQLSSIWKSSRYETYIYHEIYENSSKMWNHHKTWESQTNMEIITNDLNFKAYVCHAQTKVYIHIPNIKSPQEYMHEGTWLKDVHV